MSHPAIQKLDAYLVKAATPTALVIEIHGGGWRRGSKSQFVYQGDLMGAVIDAGISVVSIDYRLTSEHPFPAQMQDVTRAVQFVRSKAKEWNIDPNRMYALGRFGRCAPRGVGGAARRSGVRTRAAIPIERLSSRLAGLRGVVRTDGSHAGAAE